MIINCTTKEKDLLARIIRAEALSEGEMGMIMVGNVIVNRCIADCYTFKDQRTITDVIYSPNQFSGINAPLFQGKPTSFEKKVVERILNGEFYFPATHSLWFCAIKNDKCKDTWYTQPLAGRYKNHCFYVPKSGNCKELY